MTKKDLRAIFEKQIEGYRDVADNNEKEGLDRMAREYRVMAAALERMAYKPRLKLWEKKAVRYPIDQALVSKVAK